jgi:hypothetical protein
MFGATSIVDGQQVSVFRKINGDEPKLRPGAVPGIMFRKVRNHIVFFRPDAGAVDDPSNLKNWLALGEVIGRKDQAFVVSCISSKKNLQGFNMSLFYHDKPNHMYYRKASDPYLPFFVPLIKSQEDFLRPEFPPVSSAMRAPEERVVQKVRHQPAKPHVSTKRPVTAQRPTDPKRVRIEKGPPPKPPKPIPAFVDAAAEVSDKEDDEEEDEESEPEEAEPLELEDDEVSAAEEDAFDDDEEETYDAA